MINSVNDIHSTGDAIEFIEGNMERLQRMEKAIAMMVIAKSDNPYDAIALYLEYELEQIKHVG